MRKLFLIFGNCTSALLNKAIAKTGVVLLFAAAAAQPASAEVKVYAFIGQSKNSYDKAPYISGQEFAAQLDAAAATDAPEVKVSVNSGGGSVTHGNLMISAMQKCDKPVTAVIDGFAASMGYYACLGAGKILASKNSIIMLHSVQGSAAGSPEDLQAEADALKKFNATIATLLSARTGLTEAEVTDKYLGKEVYLTAQEALDAKLIDGITDYTSNNVPDVSASMSYAEATDRFTAMVIKQTETSFIDKIVAKVKEAIKPAAEKTAMLTEVEESKLSCLLYSTRYAADEAYEAIEYISDAQLKTLMQKIYDTNAGFTVEITKALYGTTMPADEVMAKAKEVTDRVAADKYTQLANKAIQAATQATAEQLAQVNTQLTQAANEIQALKAENETLKQAPAAGATRVKVEGQKPDITALTQTDDKYLTSHDRERLARLAKEQV